MLSFDVSLAARRRALEEMAKKLPPTGLTRLRVDYSERIKKILAEVKPLAVEYYRLTGKPLGVAGEIAEYLAAKHLGLKLAKARTAGYDAVRETASGEQRNQIKGRAYGNDAKPGQRIGRIKANADCDSALLVLLECGRSLSPRSKRASRSPARALAMSGARSASGISSACRARKRSGFHPRWRNSGEAAR